jgi:peptidoglycan/LPS O-acetylase OafA/YrhL
MLDPLLVAALISQTIAFRSSRLWSWLNWGWMRYLGRISYSVYLYQQISPDLARAAGSSGPLYPPVTLALVTALASGSYLIVEQPFLRLKERVGVRPASALKETA